MLKKSKVTVISENEIAKMIHVIRAKQVMLDRDLAGLYGITTSNFNRAVKRNLKRFPNHFMFSLDFKEFSSLMCQIGISKNLGRGGTRKLPYVFTEYGVAMLSSVLNSDHAIDINIRIIEAFINSKKVMSTTQNVSQKIAQLEHIVSGTTKRVDVAFDAINFLLDDRIKESKNKKGAV
jgi:uncharacterized protein YueI